MPRKGHTEGQILQTLRQAEGGEKAAEICRKLGISEQMFFTWKRKYAGVGLSEVRGCQLSYCSNPIFGWKPLEFRCDLRTTESL
jgi:hypothetical protein